MISETKLKRLYHPSMIDIYPSVNTVKENRLGSPRTYSLRNPMAMRALFRLRVLINKLISEKKIDRYTKINIEFADTTLVTFTKLEKNTIESYLTKNEYTDKAGAYAVQGYAALFVEKINGSYDNVVGLPVGRLMRELLKYKISHL